MEQMPSEYMQAPFGYSGEKGQKDGKVSVHLKTLFFVAAVVVFFFGALSFILGSQLFSTLNHMSQQTPTVVVQSGSAPTTAPSAVTSKVPFIKDLDANEIVETEFLFAVFLSVTILLPIVCAVCFYRALLHLSRSFSQFEKNGSICPDNSLSCIQELRDIETLPISLAGRLSEATEEMHRLVHRNDELKAMNLRDPLTQTFNRRAFEEMNVEMSPAPEGYVLFMVDVDHFKTINDDHGHLFGDDILKTVAKTLRMSLPVPGRIFRYGGDEFCVVASSMKPEEVPHLARTMCEAIRRIDCKGKNLTISVGASGISGIMQEKKTFHELLAQADEALYIAKRDGRDGHEVFSSFEVA